MGESSSGGGREHGILSELHLLRQEKASVQWVETKIKPIEKGISELRRAAERNHKCVKEDTLKMMMKNMEAIPTMRETLGTWVFFRNIFLGTLGTIVILSIAAVVTFTNVQADTEHSKRALVKQAEQIDSVESKIKNIEKSKAEEGTLIDVKKSLKKIEEAVLKKTRKKKKT